MLPYTESEFNDLISRFNAGKLPKAEWTHEAHLAVAFCFCMKMDLDTALSRVRVNITNHNTAVGTPNTDTEGYHETITRFWMIQVKSYILRHPNVHSTAQLLSDFLQAGLGYSKRPLDYYSEKTLFSVEARRNWVEPDLLEMAT